MSEKCIGIVKKYACVFKCAVGPGMIAGTKLSDLDDSGSYSTTNSLILTLNA